MGKKIKQVELIIVEGPSDESYLVPLKKILDSDNINTRFIVTYGDITNIESNNFEHKKIIKDKIKEQVLICSNQNKFLIKDIKRIIHIVDIDAIYCNSDDIIENSNITEVTYDSKKMIVKNKQSILERNKNKSKVLSILSTLKTGITVNKTNIKYEIYYFSTSADHVLLNKLNLTDEEKEEYSYDFALIYGEDLKAFKILLKNKSFLVDYDESWKLISKEENAFDAKTNVDLLVG